jgi:hypothetical protein
VVVTRACWWIGVVGVVSLDIGGWFPDSALAIVPVGWWVDRSIGGGLERAERFAMRALLFGVVLLALATLEYMQTDGERVAGLATRAGHL